MADAFADLPATPSSADTGWWTSPAPTFADDVDTAAGSSPYAGIPQGLNGRFEEHPASPPDSVPQAMAPAAPTYGSPFPSKDSD